MDYFIARQPVFNKKKNVIGYELLFRNGFKNFFNAISSDPDSATMEVIEHYFFQVGLFNLVRDKRGFINFTKNIIEKEIPLLLPNDKIIVEIPKDIDVDEKTLQKIKKLKEKKYLISLDNFVFQKNLLKLLDLADIIKIDFLIVQSEKERKEVIETLKIKYPNCKFLAEKVETIEDFETANKLGYNYFQGFFFSKPKIITGKQIPQNRLIFLQLMKEIGKEDLDFDKIYDIIKKDVGLSVKLLKYINSPFFGFRNEVKSLKHALALLGEHELKKWVSLVMLFGVTPQKHLEMSRFLLVRARFMELLSNFSNNLKMFQDQLFFTGLMSGVDVILQIPIEDILNEISVSNLIENALVSPDCKDNILRQCLNLILYYENALWDDVDEIASNIGLNSNDIANIYMKATEWTDKIFQ